MGKYITPSTLPSTTYCRRLLIPNSPEWIGTISGALLPLIYPSEWEQTTGITSEEASDRALVMMNDFWASNCGDEPMTDCCTEPYVIQRINPTTGQVEVSYDNGVTWTPKPGSIASQIVAPVPPVTSGMAADKCAAAKSTMGQVIAWRDQVSSDFDTAVTLLEFAFLVAAAIINAVLLILSEGALTLAETEILGIIGAAVGAIWAGGKTLFDNYWTDATKDKIFCAIYCNIGDNGSFTQDQFNALYAQIGTDLPSGAAKTLFQGFLSSVGASGISAMAAVGSTYSGDCAACDCDGCGAPPIAYIPANFDHYTYDPDTCQYTIYSTNDPSNGGKHWVGMGWSTDNSICMKVRVIENHQDGSFTKFDCGGSHETTWNPSEQYCVAYWYKNNQPSPFHVVVEVLDC